MRVEKQCCNVGRRLSRGRMRMSLIEDIIEDRTMVIIMTKDEEN